MRLHLIALISFNLVYGVFSTSFLEQITQPIQSGISQIAKPIQSGLFDLYKNAAVGTRQLQNKPVTLDKVNFYLYTRVNQSNPIHLDTENGLDVFDNHKNCSYAILIHGWTNDRNVQWFEDVKNAFLHRDEEFLVVQVDWSEPANQFYTIASISTYDVANIIANVLENLHKNHSVPLEKVLLVGHSLGAQICGFIGKRIIKDVGVKVPRIIALDPAGPLFFQRPEDKRLNKNDAKVVHVIHTDGGTFGYYGAVGTIDFYPNGGSSQPGCKQVDLVDISSITEPVTCDHRRAWKYFTEAILNPNEFLAKRCNSWSDFKEDKCEEGEVGMGDLTTTATGDYYLETNREKPYSKKASTNKGLKILKVIQGSK